MFETKDLTVVTSGVKLVSAPEPALIQYNIILDSRSIGWVTVLTVGGGDDSYMRGVLISPSVIKPAPSQAKKKIKILIFLTLEDANALAKTWFLRFSLY